MNNKRNIYCSDTRYAKVWEQMQLLNIQDVSTERQIKNGTITWRLPIKNQWNNGSFIEVGSFKTGYVRNNNSCSTNYQLNKRCESEPQYYKDYEYDSDYKQREWTGKYRKFTTRECVLIPIEIDRLEYLISYCLKNCYIKHANFIPNGDYIHKGLHNWELEKLDKDRTDREAESLNDCGHYDRIQDLESDARELESKYQASQADIRDLENKLATIQRIADHG